MPARQRKGSSLCPFPEERPWQVPLAWGDACGRAVAPAGRSLCGNGAGAAESPRAVCRGLRVSLLSSFCRFQGQKGESLCVFPLSQ